MSWTETGAKPGKIIASIIDSTGQTTRTRPVFPYRAVARYTGSGSTDDTQVDLNWMGEWLYSPGYETWCQAQGSQLNCTGGNNWSSYRKTSNGFPAMTARRLL